MNYRSIADLSRVIREGAHKVPADVDLIVGIPRSGMLPANMLALHLNRKVCDLSSFLGNLPIMHGYTRQSSHAQLNFPQDAQHILVIDDSVNSGASMEAAKGLMEKAVAGKRVTYSAAYATADSTHKVDIHFEVVPQPRAFEWNLMHRSLLDECCVDIDGVLCHDPLPEENDDGAAYRKFLLGARPLVVPTYPVGHLVTSRLEKYREETMAWLSMRGIVYRHLHMLDLPDAATRRNLGAHGIFKASIYASLTDARLFIESEPYQALEISRKAGKPALCYSNQTLYSPGFSYQALKMRNAPLVMGFAREFGGKVKRMLLGSSIQ